MLDLLIKGGTVVTPAGAGKFDVGIVGEKIVAVALPGTLGENKRTIDATGKVVVPGGIETHAHSGLGVPSRTGTFSDKPDELSLGAIWGGTTTMVDFAQGAPAEQP